MLIMSLWTAGAFVPLGDFLGYMDGELTRRQGRSGGAMFDAVLNGYTEFLVIEPLTYLSAVVLNPQRDLFEK